MIGCEKITNARGTVEISLFNAFEYDGFNSMTEGKQMQPTRVLNPFLHFKSINPDKVHADVHIKTWVSMITKNEILWVY